MIIAFLDENGNVRPPKNWEEVKESICNNWDSCEPCSYAGSYSRTHGGVECLHPLCPHEQNKQQDCCGGEPPTHTECPICGCREAGNASFVCGKHYNVINPVLKNKSKGEEDAIYHI